MIRRVLSSGVLALLPSLLAASLLTVALTGCGGGAHTVLPSGGAGSGTARNGGIAVPKSSNVALFDGTLWYGAGSDLLAVPLQSGGGPGEIDGTTDGIVDPVPVAMTVAPDATLYDLFSDGETAWQLLAYAPGTHGAARPEETIAGSGYPQQVVLVGDGIDVLATQGFNTASTSSMLFTYAYGAGNRPQPIRTLQLGPNVTDAASDNSDRIYVARRGGAGISVYPAAASCTCSPVRTIATGSRSNDAIAVSRDGIVYVLSKDSSGNVTIDAYAPGNNGPSPTRSIGPIPPSRGTPSGGITVDSDGKVYVNFRDGRGHNSVDLYAPGANGAAAPLQTIPLATYGGNVTSMAIGPTIPLAPNGPSGVLYVSNGTLVDAFSLAASGTAAPQRTIDPLAPDAPGGTRYLTIESLATAADGHLDVVRAPSGSSQCSIAAEPANASGSAVPDYTIPCSGSSVAVARGPNGLLDVAQWDGSSGPSSFLDRYAGTAAQPGELRTNYFFGGLATGPNGEIYLTDHTAVYEYAANATSFDAPIRTITLPADAGPLAVGPDGTLYVVGDQQIRDGSLSSTIYVVPPGQTSPARSIGPFAGSTDFPVTALAVDSAGELYVATNAPSGGSAVSVYAAGASGNAAPVRTLVNPVPAGTQIRSMTIFQ